MSLHTKVCLVVVGTFIAFLLVQNECRKLDGYKFPVYTTAFCPINQTEWIKRSSALKCNKSNGYLCLPNENIDQLLEFCYRESVQRIQEGICLYLVKSVSLVQSYNCSRFTQGCPDNSFFSDEIYKYAACISIGNGCFLAEPSCKSITPPHIQSTTQQFESVLTNQWNDSTTTHPQQSSEHSQLDNAPINDNNNALFVPILLGIFIPFCFPFLMCAYYIKRKYQICRTNGDVESSGRKKLKKSNDEALKTIFENKEEMYREGENEPLLNDERHDIKGTDSRENEEIKEITNAGQQIIGSSESHEEKILTPDKAMTVQGLPNISVNHETDINNRAIKLGGAVFLSDDSPGIIEVYWSKNGKLIDIQGSGGRLAGVTIDDPSLTIRSVNQEDVGNYLLTARNAIGQNTSDVISIDAPSVYILSEKVSKGENEYFRFMVNIASIPSPCLAQWYVKSKGDDTFTPLDVNAKEYQGSTNSLPHPMLVGIEKTHIEKNIYQIKVTNFVGSTVKEISDDQIRPAQNKEEYKLFRTADADANIGFAKLKNALAMNFPREKLEDLKCLLIDTKQVENVKRLNAATSARECFSILEEENLFTRNDVILVQFLCKETQCNDLHKKCITYAMTYKALCFIENPPDNGYKKVEIHIQEDFRCFAGKQIKEIVKIVAAMLECQQEEILVVAVRPSESVILVLSVMEECAWKFSALNEEDSQKLKKLKIDYLVVDEKTIFLETSKDVCHATDCEEGSLNKIQMSEIEKPQAKVGQLLRVMSCPELHHLLELTEFGNWDHISCVTSDLIWVSKTNNLILINTQKVTLHRLEDLGSECGSHTVNSEKELIYIDSNDNIKKLSTDMEKNITFIDKKVSPWKPQSVYCTPLTGDLLIGMLRRDKHLGKVDRYNRSGQLIQTIQHGNKGQDLYRTPYYITVNNNGDVVVSDYQFAAVVVTDFGGKLRFFYRGYQSGSELRPKGICTDPMSHILVCDDGTSTVQMLDKDGNFLSNLLKSPHWIQTPRSLSFDLNTQHLWVGSAINANVCAYRYIDQNDALSVTDYAMRTTKKEQQESTDENV